MLAQWILLCFMLVIILIASELFTNALEYFGERIGISAGVVGSIFAAVATALPETSIPIIALIAGSSDTMINQEIGVGAILGAPLMLSTLSIFIMSLSVIKQRGIFGRIKPEITGFTRDLNFFLLAFILSAAAMYIPFEPHFLRVMVSIVLILFYIIYLYLTCKASKSLVEAGHGVAAEEPMYLAKIGFKINLFTIILQFALGIILLVAGAKGFIVGVQAISKSLHISVLILSLLIIPIATELPEKINSIIWVRKNKDTLGVGNITGAMVFQGTLLPALGILLTPWQPVPAIKLGILLTIAGAAWLRFNADPKGISIIAFFVNGFFYLVYLVFSLIH